jgi:hypothetical protein
VKLYTVEVGWAEVVHRTATVTVITDKEVHALAVATAQVRNAAPGRRAINATCVATEPAPVRAVVAMTPMDSAEPHDTTTPMPELPPSPGRQDHHGARHDEP